jgi:ABC-type enterochelin transport system ATPase subunit
LVVNNDPDGLASAAHIQAPSSKNLISHLSASEDVEGLLALEHGELLQDSPTIRFRKDDGKYYELSQLSVGQKCTALLVIALADGSRPVIIDQPEDALDITSVYEDVTLQLRSRKHARQFIVTTHNPTVAVASDSDQFHVLKASASQAQLSTKGAIDRPVVRAAVIQHLEGGAEPFALKTKKYGLPVR